ncbi:MAG: Malonyl CoA-acyl carrier protein transacylase [Chlamydiales bacterium]|jgi:[acyl-carrier-protein] S-malonyltransferase|nr:Malonyl CoA-acyl carrier protein transacylase [Chlamydiales bacterium]
MSIYHNVGFIFPGQGAQYVGMGKDLYEAFPIVRSTFEEAHDILHFDLFKLIQESDEATLAKTIYSQPAIYVFSMAIMRLLYQQHKDLQPSVCAGLSLGEYSALTASGRLSFHETVQLVQRRGQFMGEACRLAPGTMAVVMGLDADTVLSMIQEINLPHDLWAANFNCPGQIVISGTKKGIDLGIEAAKGKGAKRVLPLQVEGAFHSGLMLSAQEKLAPYIHSAPIQPSHVDLFMNVTAALPQSEKEVKENLTAQVTHYILWEDTIRKMMERGVDLYIELGCGKTLTGMNKRIGVTAASISIENCAEFDKFSELWTATK